MLVRWGVLSCPLTLSPWCLSPALSHHGPHPAMVLSLPSPVLVTSSIPSSVPNSGAVALPVPALSPSSSHLAMVPSPSSSHPCPLHHPPCPLSPHLLVFSCFSGPGSPGAQSFPPGGPRPLPALSGPHPRLSPQSPAPLWAWAPTSPWKCSSRRQKTPGTSGCSRWGSAPCSWTS